MRLTLTSNDGEVLDTLVVSADEFRAAQDNATAAMAMLNEFHPGIDPDGEEA